jgi:hypothetical protein
MLRQKKRLMKEEEQLQEAARIERLMAAGWKKPEISKGLRIPEDTVGKNIKSATGRSFKQREAEIACEVVDASIRAGMGLSRIYAQLNADETSLHARITLGRSLQPVQVGKPSKRVKAGEEAARVAVIERLMSAGWKKPEIAKGLGLTLSGFEKFWDAHAKDARGTFRDRENVVALDVTRASVRAGRSTKQILNQLHIDPTTLKDRLKRMGTRLVDIQEEYKQEAYEAARKGIKEVYAEYWGKIPDGAEARWQHVGGLGDSALYSKVFQQLVDGKTSKEAAGTLGIGEAKASDIAALVRPELLEHDRIFAEKAYVHLEPPVVTEKQKKVFWLVAVQGYTTDEAISRLNETSPGITAIKKNLIEKFPELEGVLKHTKSSQQQ